MDRSEGLEAVGLDGVEDELGEGLLLKHKEGIWRRCDVSQLDGVALAVGLTCERLFGVAGDLSGGLIGLFLGGFHLSCCYQLINCETGLNYTGTQP